MKNKAIILLSGGLDSYVAFDMAAKKYDIELALNFDYGQKAFKEENNACKRIIKRYQTKLKTIKLAFLKELCDNALVDFSKNDLDNFKEVWIPNRNGLFINIAASYCDKYNLDKIILGLNFEEAQKFPDNSIDFIKNINKSLKYSTLVRSEIYAPCAKMTKVDIINYAIDNNLDLNIIKSCYNSSSISDKKHCGKCMSCKLLYNAIIKSKKPELIREIF